MPLIKGKSSDSFDHNVKTEIASGRPQNQALAIAYSMKRRAKKMAQGGVVKDDVPEPNQKAAEEFQKGATESGFQPAKWVQNIKEGLGLDDKKEPQHYSKGGMVDQIMNRRKMADGGMVEGEMPEDDSEMFHEEQEDDGDNEDFLSSDEQDSLPEEPDMKKKRIISGIMRSLHSRHYGR